MNPVHEANKTKNKKYYFFYNLDSKGKIDAVERSFGELLPGIVADSGYDEKEIFTTLTAFKERLNTFSIEWPPKDDEDIEVEVHD